MHALSPNRSRPREQADRSTCCRPFVRLVKSAATPFWLIVAILAVSDFASAAPAPSPPALDRDLRPFLAEHCVKCHGPEKQKGDVRLDTLNLADDLAKDRELLTLVRDQIRDGLMPPKKKSSPTPPSPSASRTPSRKLSPNPRPPSNSPATSCRTRAT